MKIGPIRDGVVGPIKGVVILPTVPLAVELQKYRIREFRDFLGQIRKASRIEFVCSTTIFMVKLFKRNFWTGFQERLFLQQTFEITPLAEECVHEINSLSEQELAPRIVSSRVDNCVSNAIIIKPHEEECRSVVRSYIELLSQRVGV